MAEENRSLVFEEILSKSQTDDVVTQFLGKSVSWSLKKSEVRQMEGMPGYLGDHLKAVLHIDAEGEEKTAYLFIKRIPIWNKPKTRFIEENNFFKRERLMFNIVEEICKEGVHPWCVKAYIYTDSILVMPDLSMEGYLTTELLKYLDIEHVFLTTTSIAQFHAAFVNYETKKSSTVPYRTSQEFEEILAETVFCDTPFLRACSKLSKNLLLQLSTKSYLPREDLESKLTKLYIDACDTLKEYEDTVNVLIHRDLWVNNIMFKYENNVPVNCVLIDYQCMRYGPPAFDLMILLYLTTDRGFRQEREEDIFAHYYSTFVKHLSEDSKKRVKDLGYDKDNFLSWCQKARMFAMFEAIAIFPFILMEQQFALKTMHDPANYEKYVYKDRTEPVLAHARDCEDYRRRNLEVTEEFVETYLE